MVSVMEPPYKIIKCTSYLMNYRLLGNYYEGKKEGKWINLLFVSKDGLILCEEGKYVNNL